MRHLLLLCTLACLVAGCQEIDLSARKDEPAIGFTTVTYAGHSYVRCGIRNGGGIVHDPDCPCQGAFSLPTTAGTLIERPEAMPRIEYRVGTATLVNP